MRIISRAALRNFWQQYPEAESSLRMWYKVAKKAGWENIMDTRGDFPHADFVGVCTIFNIGGNNYRLVTKIYYPAKKVLIRFVLTHAEYNKKPYKNDCEC